MKKFVIYIMFALAISAGCKKNNDQLIDGQKSEQRIIDALNGYSAQLTGSPYGWKAYVYPKDGGGYSFYFNFNQKNRVTMYSDLDDASATTSVESSYLIKAYQIPTLSFDTYNYLHRPADPAVVVPGGTIGWGLHADFEFPFQKSSGDTLKFTGKLFSENQMVMVKATQAEQTAYNAKGLFDSRSSAIKYFAANPNLYLDFGDGVKVQTAFNYTSKTFSLIWAEAGNVISKPSAFVFTLNGIFLQKAISYKGNNISEILWDASKKSFYVMIAGKRSDVLVSSTPILPLYLLIGVGYNSITLPDAITYPGWSTDFIARRAAANRNTLNGGYNLRLGKMVFQFNTTDQLLNITVDIFQNATGFTAVFPYSYTRTANGVYKFTAGTVIGNGSLIVNEMAPLTTQRLSSDTFTLDYFVNPNTGATLGQFKSVEHPDFTFSGALQ